MVSNLEVSSDDNRTPVDPIQALFVRSFRFQDGLELVLATAVYGRNLARTLVMIACFAACGSILIGYWALITYMPRISAI
jgi:hypothetical protein